MTLADALAAAGLFVAIIGIPAAYVFARRGRQRPDLRAVIDTAVELNADGGLVSEGLEISFLGRRIERVTRTVVAFWNERGDTVKGQDIVERDPLRIELDGDDNVLQARVIRQSRPQIELKTDLMDEDATTVVISFDFLDAGDGGLVEILHHNDASPTLLGTVRGTKISRIADVSLSAVALDAARQRSVLVARLKWLFSRTAAPESRVYVLSPLFYGLLSGYFVTRFIQALHAPQLVDWRRFRLNSISGQAAFAEEVERIGASFTHEVLWLISDRIAWLILGMYFVGGTIMSVWSLMGGSRRIVPRSILNPVVLQQGEGR